MTLAESAHEDNDPNDILVELNGINLVFSSGIKSYLTGKLVDYRTGPSGTGFTITDENPNRLSCGDCSC